MKTGDTSKIHTLITVAGRFPVDQVAIADDGTWTATHTGGDGAQATLVLEAGAVIGHLSSP